MSDLPQPTTNRQRARTGPDGRSTLRKPRARRATPGRRIRYCIGPVQPVPLELTWHRSKGGPWAALGENSTGWFWLRDRRFPSVRGIIGPIQWIRWLVRELNRLESQPPAAGQITLRSVIDYAKRRLPHGYSIQLHVGRDAADVILCTPDGDEVPMDSSMTIQSQFVRALQIARDAAPE